MKSQRSLLALVTILASITVCYSNSFSCPFLFDDIGAIVYNESIRDLENLWTVLTDLTAGTVSGRPLLNLTLAVNYAFTGTENVWDYHAFNLALHCANAIVLFDVVRRTLRLPRIPDELRDSAVGLSFATTLLWAIHPLQTESVTYIIQRAEALSAFFYLMTLYCFLRSATSTHSEFWKLLSIVACLLGMASKETLVTAPVVVLLYDRIFLCHSWKELVAQHRRFYAALFATWIWLAWLMWSSQSRKDSAGFGLGISPWDYAMTQFVFIVKYLKLVYVPSPLVFDYGDYIAHQPAEIVPCAFVVLLLLCVTGRLLFARPKIGFLGITFFLILAPTSTVVPIVTQTGAEHRMYLPLAPIVLLTILIARRLLQRVTDGYANFPADRTFRGSVLSGILVLFAAVVLGLMTYQRNNDYQSEFILWEKTARDFPENVRAFHKVGTEYLKRGQIGEAIECFDQIVKTRPEKTLGYLSRGDAYAVSKQYDLALRDYSHVTQMPEADPAMKAQTYVQMANVYYLMGKSELALESCDRALELEPDHGEAIALREQIARRIKTP